MFKLKHITRTEVYKYIALEARTCIRYEYLSQCVEAQTMDPITGLIRDDKVHGLISVQDNGEGWGQIRASAMLRHFGLDPNSPNLWEVGVGIINDAKGEGKGDRREGQGKNMLVKWRNWLLHKRMPKQG